MTTTGSWYQLLDTLRLIRQYILEDTGQPPTTCPHDGEPLSTGPDGQPYCPYDGWRPH